MSSHAIIYGIAVITLGLVIFISTRAKRNPLQPRTVPALIPIPFIGHALGLLIHRNAYYTKICQRYNLPILSLPMFGGNCYVVQSPNLIYSLQRQPRSLSLWFFEAIFTVKCTGIGKASAETMMQGIQPQDDAASPLIEVLKGMKTAMSAEGKVGDMVRDATGIVSRALDDMTRQGRQTVDLFAWVRHEVTAATTEAVYGPANPYRDPKVESGFWDFMSSTMLLALPSILGRVFANKAIAGRETVVKALDRYYASEGNKSGSQLVKARYDGMKGFISIREMSYPESLNGLAVLSNTVPVAFWSIFHTFSDPSLLDRVRAEVETITTVVPSTAGHPERRSIGLAKLKDAPILFSLIQETIRYRARGTGPRMALEDIALTDDQRTYHIEKGSVVIIAHHAMHLNQEAWGFTADTFLADRFLHGKKIPTNAFRGFGGGANACPGRNFALTEIAALLAMLVARFEIRPVEERWEALGQDLSNMASEHPPPDRELMVDIVPRKCMEGIVWAYEDGAA